jgi:hypothetical protein
VRFDLRVPLPAPGRFVLLRQETPWRTSGRNGVLGFGGFRKDSTFTAKGFASAEQVALRLGAGSFTFVAPGQRRLSGAEQGPAGNLEIEAGAIVP